ncbi:hypothetical protein J4731_22725 [Providencia rettgeri]|nr:hypothetical protein [Providencia rettgeri]
MYPTAASGDLEVEIKSRMEQSRALFNPLRVCLFCVVKGKLSTHFQRAIS